MAWLRIEDTVPEHPKHLKVGPAASWLWLCSIAYCQRQLTDGYLPDACLIHLGCPTDRRQVDNIYRLIPTLVSAGLWDRDPGGDGYRVHDYQEYNDTREAALARKTAIRDQRRLAGLASAAARAKQQTANEPVDRPFNPHPHPHPLRTKEQTKERDPGIQTVAPSNGNGNGNGHASLSSPDPFVNTEITMRAGEFVRQYEALYQKCRNGALYAVKPTKDYASAVTLCHTWADDAHLLRLAKIFLTTDHKFAVEGSRTITQFLALASWCDGRLADVKAGKA